MPRIFIDGQPFDARTEQTVLQVADEHGIFIPRLCWHPQLSVAGNCRICVVQVEGRSWVEISCNMPVSEGLKVLTDSELVRAHRKATMQFLTLNHPVDCGICDKAGECTLQDYHVAFNGEPSISAEPKVASTKFYALSERITLDNERCILCTRCVRFTREVSKSHALGVQERGDHSVIRPAGGSAKKLDDDPYSDNIVDLCPVGALLSRSFLHRDRVWYLKATPSVCPGCERGCAIDIWHRKPEWLLRSPTPGAQRENRAIARVTPLGAQHGDRPGDVPSPHSAEAYATASPPLPWICNKGRDLAGLLERPRSTAAMKKGREVPLAEAVAAARELIGRARRPVALISSWASNEELLTFQRTLAPRFTCFVKSDHPPAADETVQDDLLIRADKNPNAHRAREFFGHAALTFPPDTDLVLVWGEGFDFATAPRGVPVIFLNAYFAPENGHADVFFAISVMTERAGHYTNFEGTVRAFLPCFAKPAGVADAEQVFEALAALAAAGARSDEAAMVTP
ncbi:MAG: (2Fe-2S)-binding protein [Rubrivivax sp.]|nr:(2Fe-2S)-binding protein [Rubrivivax sp.]